MPCYSATKKLTCLKQLASIKQHLWILSRCRNIIIVETKYQTRVVHKRHKTKWSIQLYFFLRCKFSWDVISNLQPGSTASMLLYANLWSFGSCMSNTSWKLTSGEEISAHAGSIHNDSNRRRLSKIASLSSLNSDISSINNFRSNFSVTNTLKTQPKHIAVLSFDAKYVIKHSGKWFSLSISGNDFVFFGFRFSISIYFSYCLFVWNVFDSIWLVFKHILVFVNCDLFFRLLK